MSTFNTCRVCLQAQPPFYNILDSPLHEIFEKITNMKVDLIDRSHVLCLLCHSHLKKTLKLVQRAKKSEEYLLSLIVNQLEMAKEIKFDAPHSLSLSKTEVYNYFDGFICKDEPKATEVTNQDLIKNDNITCTNIYDDMIHFDYQEIKEEANLSDDKADTNLKSNAKVVAPCDSANSDDESLLKIMTRMRQNVVNANADSGEGQNDPKVVMKSKNGKNSQKKATDNLKNLDATSDTPKKNQFSCSLCDRTFTQKRYLTKHKQIHSGIKPFTCSYCNREFRIRQTLIRHLRIHTGEKPFTCSVCDRKFTDRITLTKHFRTHTGDKPYHCTFCSRKFSQIDALSKHVRLHTGEKPHHCTYCDSKFARKDDLIYHLRTHTGERPHHCTNCDRKFTQKQGLVRHMRTHTGEKPYSCSYCDFKCTQGQALTRHLRLHTGEKPFTCNHCDKKLIDKTCLLRHLRTHNLV